jgi:hypothetical protein
MKIENSRKIGYVVTTIYLPTMAMKTLSALIAEQQKELLSKATKDSDIQMEYSELYVVGDKKTPSDWNLSNARFLSVSNQLEGDSLLAKVLPWNSYSRKMLGYLESVKDGCQWIRETDDDNIPRLGFLEYPQSNCLTRTVETIDSPWINLYSAFTSRRIWPRGLPLQVLNGVFLNPASISDSLIEVKDVVIYQALADGEPDVDALYRLTVEEESNISFEDFAPLLVPKSSITPFNSQATTWHRSVFPLMYLPITCSFRMTDIWRSFVAQRLLKTTELNIVFLGAEVFQERNPHNLIKDFEDEIEGYLGNEGLRIVLENTPITGGVKNFIPDLLTLYVALVEAGFLQPAEIESLHAWCQDLRSAGWGE